jgi:hypothetical protein
MLQPAEAKRIATELRPKAVRNMGKTLSTNATNERTLKKQEELQR